MIAFSGRIVFLIFSEINLSFAIPVSRPSFLVGCFYFIDVRSQELGGST
jgi:hypothetical protein